MLDCKAHRRLQVRIMISTRLCGAIQQQPSDAEVLAPTHTHTSTVRAIRPHDKLTHGTHGNSAPMADRYR